MNYQCCQSCFLIPIIYIIIYTYIDCFIPIISNHMFGFDLVSKAIQPPFSMAAPSRSFFARYCPAGVSSPQPTPPGHYVGQSGSIYPSKCRPGTYAANWLMMLGVNRKKVPQFVTAKLVNITPITMVYGKQTIVNGVYKPTYNYGHHLVGSTTSLFPELWNDG